MSNLTTIHDLESGEIIVREMTDKEIAEQRKLEINVQAEKDAVKAKRQAVLERLGITEDEAKLLLG